MTGKLTVFEKDGALWTDSREAAAMVDKQHKNLLADIRGYIAVMQQANPKSGEVNELNFQPVDFFMESSYTDEKGEARPCYLISKKGCEFVANKLTGQKGVLFTAAYVTGFNAMEERLQTPQSYLQALRALVASEEQKLLLSAQRDTLQAELDRSKDWYSIKRVAALNRISWKEIGWKKFKAASKSLGFEVRKIFDANYGEVDVYHRNAARLLRECDG